MDFLGILSLLNELLILCQLKFSFRTRLIRYFIKSIKSDNFNW